MGPNSQIFQDFAIHEVERLLTADLPIPKIPKFSPLLDQRPSLSHDPTVIVPPSRSRDFMFLDFMMVLSFEPSTPKIPKCRCFRSMTTA
jgi:hypothetical protein